MEELLTFIIKKIADKPDKLTIEKLEENNHITFSVTLDEEDKGKVIGKNGRNVKSIRQILSIIAKRENKTVSVKIE